jgi:antitoxin (DNA-binding transcriptional repressor) of toxin-antitoxin stability system
MKRSGIRGWPKPIYKPQFEKSKEAITMHQVSIREAESQLSQLIQKACRGEEVIITLDSHPLVRLMALAKPKGQRRFGAMAGRARVDDAFFEPYEWPI